METCSGCKYFSFGKQSGGECRRYPPVVVILNDYPLTEWPKVDSDEWCGEWRDAAMVPKSKGSEG